MKLQTLLQQEEKYWRQYSKQLWLQASDSSNTLDMLRVENVNACCMLHVACYEEANMQALVFYYFDNIFKYNGHQDSNFSTRLNLELLMHRISIS